MSCPQIDTQECPTEDKNLVVTNSCVNNTTDAESVCSSLGSGWELSSLTGSCHPTIYSVSGSHLTGIDVSIDESNYPSCIDTSNTYQKVKCTRSSLGVTDTSPSSALSCCFTNSFCAGLFSGVKECYTLNGGLCPDKYTRLGDDGYCSSSPSGGGVCDTCYAQSLNFCTSGGNSLLPQKWVSDQFPVDDIFVNQPCTEAFLRTLYTGQPSPAANAATECNPDILDFINSDSTPVINPLGYSNAKKMFTIAVEKYTSSGGNLLAPVGTSGSNTQFNNFVYKICSLYPGMCTEILTGLCSNTSTEDLQRNPTAQSFCGCYLPINLQQEFYSNFGISNECNPYCNMDTSLQLSDGTFTGSKTCTQTVCMMNDISINLIQSQVSGSISIGNVCSSCGGNGLNTSSGCQCIFNNISVTAVNSQIPSLNITQSCGSKQCSKTVNGIKENVDCTTGKSLSESNPNVKSNTKNAQSKHNIIILILFIALFFILVLFYVLINPNTKIPRVIPPIYSRDYPVVANYKPMSLNSSEFVVKL